MSTTKMHCYRHPDRETLLRCNRCENPICTSCAVSTPTGYRCPDCVRKQQKVFDTAENLDYIIGVGVALVISFLGSLLAGSIGFISIFLAGFIGMAIAEIVRRLIKGRRSRRLFRFTAGAAAIGGVPLLLSKIIQVFFILSVGSAGSFYVFLPLVWQGLYIMIVFSSVYYRLSGIEIRAR